MIVIRQPKFMGASSFAGPRSMAAPLSQLLQNARSCLSPSGNDHWRGVRSQGDAAQPPTFGLPQKQPIGRPNGDTKTAPLARAPFGRWSVAAPCGPAGQAFCRGRLYPISPCTQPINLHRFTTIAEVF